MAKTVAVVGSGPSALAAVKALLESEYNLEIIVLDALPIKPQDNAVGLKSYFGSTDMYDQSESSIHHRGLKPVVWPSTSLGGFSRIWGAVIGQLPSENFGASIKFGKDGKFPEIATRSAIHLKDRYKRVVNPSWILLDHFVAVNSKKCNNCGKCLTGCPTDAIWFAGIEWEGIRAIKFDSDFKVKDIDVQKERVIVTSHSGKEIITDSVFLAAGAIASTQILMTSNLIPRDVIIHDTRAIFFPALRFPVKESSKSFALSQLSATLKLQNLQSSYIQFYPDSRSLIQPLRQHRPWLGLLLSKIWKWISPIVMTGIMYMNQEDSAGIRLRMINGSSYELSKHGENVSLGRFLRKNRITQLILRDFGIFPIFLLSKKGEPGESYHFGLVSEIISFNNHSGAFPVKVVDASALPSLVPGPITDNVMVNAKTIVQKFLSENYEIPD